MERIGTLTLRRLTLYGFGLIGGLAAFGLAVLIAGGPFEFASIATRHASRSLGRPVTIASLSVRFGASIAVTARDLVLDNVPGGSQPRMLEVARLDAEIAPWSLVLWALTRHALEVRHLSIDGVKLLLEHGPDEHPNWRFSGSRPSVAEQRAEFPALLGARLGDTEIDLRLSSGKILRITLNEATITAPGVNQQVTLSGAGAYNATPIQLTAMLESFDALHDAARPFGTDLHFSSGTSTLDFVGTMTDPLNADGADGKLALSAPNWRSLLAIAGVGGQLELPLILAGPATRQGDLWRLTEASGTLRGHPFKASAQLREGARHAPDDITLNAGLSVLDLTGLRVPGEGGETTLRIDDDPGTLVDAHVTAKELVRGALRAADVELKAKLAPGSLVIEPLVLRLAGGGARIDAAMENTKSSVATRFDAALTGAGVNQLFGLLGLGALPLSGAVDARASVRLTGNTLTEAARSNRGVIVLSMQGGSIERKIIEGASTDLRLLFRPAEGSGQIACLLGVLDLRDGVGRIAPLRIKTAEGTIAGAGTLDLRNDTIDVTVASESASTGLFALDVPMRIAGPILDPHVTPLVFGRASDLARASADPREMPPAIQAFVLRNRCFVAGRQ